MIKPKVWKIKDYEGSFTDEDLVKLICDGQVKGDFYITTKEIKKWIKVEDSIYQFYLEGEKNETL